MIDWENTTIGNALREAASTWGAKEALTSKDCRYSYEALYRASCQLASGLSRLGVGKGDHVATLFPIRPEWVVAKYALGKARVDTLITFDMLPQGNYLEILAAMDPSIASSEKGQIRSQALPSLKRIICLSPGQRTYPHCAAFLLKLAPFRKSPAITDARLRVCRRISFRLRPG